MNIVIKDATVVSMSEARPKIEENMDIWIQENTIKAMAKNLEIEGAMIVKAKGKVIMPGLINTHAHLPMSIFRETIDGYSLQDWLSKKIWPMEDKLTKQDIKKASMLSCLEMIKTGTTTVNDMYFMTEEIINAAKQMGIRMQTTRTLMDLGEDGQERLQELENLLKAYHKKEDRISWNIGIHGFYTTNASYLNKCSQLANQYSLPIHIHFCENAKEVEDIQRTYQVKSPVTLVKQYFQGQHVILAHAVKLSEKEIEVLGKENVFVSHCPVSNLKLGCGIANITKMQECGITVSLGTDGQGSGSNLDLFETMKLTALLQKGNQEDPIQLPAYEVLKMATIDGAKTLGLEESIGSLEEGKRADLIMVDLESVTTQPVNNLISQLVYNVKGSNVVMTMIDGKILMQDRKMKIIDEKAIYQACNGIIERIQN